MSVQPGAPIRVRRFGRTDLQVSEFGFGCARIGGVFKSDPAEFGELLTTAFDAGITFFDTADIYSQGESEKLVGRAFKGRRDRVVIASKAGWVLPAQRKVVAHIKPLVRPLVKLLGLSRSQLPSAVRGEMAQDFSAAYLHRAVEASLRRLQTDFLDLLQLHSPPESIVRDGDWLSALESLKRQGKVRYYGISCDTVEAAHAALAYDGVSSLQLPISILEHSFLDVLPRARERGVGVIARECLANGLLVKQLSAQEIRPYCHSDEEAARKSTLLDEHRRAAAAAGQSTAARALNYASGLDGVSVSLVGASRLSQLTDLLATGLPARDHQFS
jgi:aryl-alcohol dehydrogenase-like predicted oxidoreductase